MSPPRSEPDLDRRARILEAALEVCQRHGVEGARMEEVAARAGVSKGTLYRYFENKEELLLATVIDSYQQNLPLFDAGADPASDPVESSRLCTLASRCGRKTNPPPSDPSQESNDPVGEERGLCSQPAPAWRKKSQLGTAGGCR